MANQNFFRLLFRRGYWTTQSFYAKESPFPKHKLVLECPKPSHEVKDLDKFKIPSEIPPPAVVIVGAGMAGLSAAHRLLTCGIPNVTILEALERPGGRIHTCDVNGDLVDLGADHIDGGSLANPVYTLACYQGIVGRRTDKFMSGSPLFYHPDSGPIMAPKKLFEAMTNASDHAVAVFTTTSMSSVNQGQNLDKFLWNKLRETLPPETINNRDNLSILNGLMHEMRSRWGDNLKLVSTDYYGSFIDIPGGLVSVNGGCAGLLVPLLKDIPPEKIKYNKPVQTIHWSSYQTSKPRVVIKCCDGEEVPADYVILTASLGVLKSQMDRLFCPPLPPEKKEAISNISFGFADKIILQFEHPFWLPDEGVIRIAWTPEDLGDRNHWTKGISIVKAVGPAILEVTVGGKEAIWMLNSPMKDVVEDLMEFLRKLTWNPALPFPCNMMRSKWGKSLFFMGSGSYMGRNSSIHHQCQLATPLPGIDEPIPPTLLFAGEATCPGHFSTLQGARFSGIREADRIINLTLELHGSPHKEDKCAIPPLPCRAVQAPR